MRDNHSDQLQINRNLSIDIVRVISLTAIFLLHAAPARIAFSLLQFCVPAMLFISGLCFKENIATGKEYRAYLKKRFVKLFIPMSCFAFLFSIAVDIFCLLIGREKLFSPSDILAGTLLYDGVGYVWIMRVFFLVACLSPVACLFRKQKNDIAFVGTTVLLYVIYRLLYNVVSDGTWIYHVLNYFVFDTIPYFIVFLFAVRYKDYSPRKRTVSAGLLLVATVVILAFHNFDVSIIYGTKYPPQLPYLTYGLLVSVLLYELFVFLEKKLKMNRLLKGIQQISINSNKLYIAHIPFAYFTMFVEERIKLPYILKLTVITLGAFITLYIFNKFVQWAKRILHLERMFNK